MSVGLGRAKAQWWVISFKLTSVQNNLHIIMLLYSPSDCHGLSTGEIPLGGKNPFPTRRRNVGAIGKLVCLREIQVAQKRKKKMAHAPLMEKDEILHCITLSWHSATRGGMDQREINFASCLDGGFPAPSPPSFGAGKTTSVAM